MILEAQTRDLIRGRPLAYPLAGIQAYLDWRRFGALPRPGGAFDQPADLMDEMRYVADRVSEHEAKQAADQAKKATRH